MPDKIVAQRLKDIIYGCFEISNYAFLLHLIFSLQNFKLNIFVSKSFFKYRIPFSKRYIFHISHQQMSK